MRLLGNLIWLLLGGLELALVYAIAGLIMFVLIITIPFGVQAFKMASFTLWPFGRAMVPREGASAGLSAIGNLIWIVLAGLWLAIGHVLAAVLTAITIIGIPFAVAHLKLAGIALTPFGNTVVPMEEARRRNLRTTLAVPESGKPAVSTDETLS